MMADFVTGRWSAELEVLFLRVSGRFGRIEVRRRMRDYVPGLLGPVSRKNSPPEGAPPRQLAECAGHNGDPDELRDDVQSYVAEKLGAPGGVLIVDDTGFVKQGTVSAGVQRQYSGTAGACP
ncbi:transposase [Streptomyces sp. NRRL WC-3701]|nr:transposase [Streptomyces sp. NRRL WC-3701]